MIPGAAEFVAKLPISILEERYEVGSPEALLVDPLGQRRQGYRFGPVYAPFKLALGHLSSSWDVGTPPEEGRLKSQPTLSQDEFLYTTTLTAIGQY
jgi:hypothetical protein